MREEEEEEDRYGGERLTLLPAPDLLLRILERAVLLMYH